MEFILEPRSVSQCTVLVGAVKSRQRMAKLAKAKKDTPRLFTCRGVVHTPCYFGECDRDTVLFGTALKNVIIFASKTGL